MISSLTSGGSVLASTRTFEESPLSDWEMARVPAEVKPAEEVFFQAAEVPGTVASNLQRQKAWKPEMDRNFDSEHWCFRCRFEASPCQQGEQVFLRFGGIATLSEVRLNGRLILESDSMFASHEVNVSGILSGQNELLINCRSLTPALRAQRSRKPLARWKTQIVAEQQLRWFRTTLRGRSSGFTSGPEPVGPWRPVTLVRAREAVSERQTRTVKVQASDGLVQCVWRIRCLRSSAAPLSGKLISGDLQTSLAIREDAGHYLVSGSIRIPNVPLWWPHTHGDPSRVPLYASVKLENGSELILDDQPVGFRTVEGGLEPAGVDGLQIRINGTPIFCRGVVWMPCDVGSLSHTSAAAMTRLRLLRDAGFNLIRVGGTTVYESDAFHAACEELGLLIWQDMMFANMDYPFGDETFYRAVCGEAETELCKLSRYASTTVICGNSEIEQQVGMLGLDTELSRIPFFDEDLPRLIDRHCPGVPYLPSAPCGGDLPFRTDRGVANYFGVGAYLRPLEDVRRAGVRFASECLAFANVPEPEAIESLSRIARTQITPVTPVWRQSTPRDAGTGWDFDDVRDHYLKMLFSVDPLALRYADVDRYWELSRVVSGEVMAEVFGEWRRSASPCNGAIILSSADLQPGAGWGILDSNGCPKAPYWFLKRILAPSAIWMTNEGLNGVDIHVAHEGPSPLSATLCVALYRNGEQKLEEITVPLELPKHSRQTLNVEQLLKRFVDVSYAYRFGPPRHNLVVTTLYANPVNILLSQSFLLPMGRPSNRGPIAALGLSAEARLLSNGKIEVALHSRRFAYAVRVWSEGFLPSDAYFHLAPALERRILLTPLTIGDEPAQVSLSAVNAEGTLPLPIGKSL